MFPLLVTILVSLGYGSGGEDFLECVVGLICTQHEELDKFMILAIFLVWEILHIDRSVVRRKTLVLNGWLHQEIVCVLIHIIEF